MRILAAVLGAVVGFGLALEYRTQCQRIEAERRRLARLAELGANVRAIFDRR